MRRLLYLTTLLLCALSLPALAQIAGAGRSFVLAWPFAINNHNIQARPRLYLFSEQNTTADLLLTASGVRRTVPIAAGTSAEVLLDSADMMAPRQTGIFYTSVQITSPVNITATLFADVPFATEAYAGTPDSLLGREHYAVSTKDNTDGDFILVVGVHDSTHVTITPAFPTRDGHPTGVPYSVTVNRGEVYQTFSTPDFVGTFTGTRVVADQPCSVLSGAVCADFVNAVLHSCNPLVDAVPHADSWGKRFVIAPMIRQLDGVVNVVARCPNTEVRFNGNKVYVLGPGESAQTQVGEQVEITASEPVMVAQMVVSTGYTDRDQVIPYGDPSMAVAPPTMQWGRAFHIVSPVIAPRQETDGVPVGWRHFVHVMMRDAAEATVRIDNAPPVWLQRTSVGGYVVGIAEVAVGDHGVTCADPVGILAYGYSGADAYAYAPGNIQGYQVRGTGLAVTACADSLDTIVVLANMGSDPVRITAVAFNGDVSGVLLPPTSLPIDVAPGDSVRLRVRLHRVGTGRKQGTIDLFGASCVQHLAALPVEFGDAAIDFTPPVGTEIDFGAVAGTSTSVRTIAASNRGDLPLRLDALTLGTGDWTLVSPTLPVTIAPGGTAVLTLRFAPGAAVRRYRDTALIAIAGCSDHRRFPLVGERASGGALAASVDAVRLLCTPRRADTMVVRLVNIGDQPFRITNATLLGAHAAEFALLDVLPGVQVTAASTLRARVLYTPAGLGPRDARLRLETTAINAPTVDITLDVRNDSLALTPLLTLLDLGTALECDPPRTARVPFVNTGTLSVSSFDVAWKDAANGSAFIGPAPVRPGDTVWLSATTSGTLGAGIIDDSVVVRLTQCDYAIALPATGRRLRVALSADVDTLVINLDGVCDSVAFASVRLHNGGEVVDSLRYPAFVGEPFAQVNYLAAVEPGSDSTISFRFRPRVPGVYFAQFSLASRPCGRSVDVVLKGIYTPGNVLSTAALDFGAVAYTGAGRRQLVIRNTTASVMNIDAPIVTDLAARVRVVSPVGPMVILPGDSVVLTLEYRPASEADTLIGELVLQTRTPCSRELRVDLLGLGVKELTRVGLWWEDAGARAGEETLLRLMLDQGAVPIVNDTIVLRAGVRFNRTMLLPLDVRGGMPGIDARITGDIFDGAGRVVTIEARGLLPAVGPVALLRARAMLGDADTTILAFAGARAERAATLSAVQVADTTPGVFRTLGICRVGAPRLLGVGSPLKIAAVQPNPADERSRITFDILEQGRGVMALHDMGGRMVATLFDADLAPGSYALDVDLHGLPVGVYRLVLSSGTARDQARLMIVR